MLRAQGKGLRGFNSMIVRLKVEIFPSPKFHSLNGFNSMIVRLKEGEINSSFLDAASFQFYDSPIKSVPDNIKDTIRKRFNSMIVRLKDTEAYIRTVCKRSFNSMIVRLKEEKEASLLAITTRFQFYDSPIKSFFCHQSHLDDNAFQFYDSPIKSL